MIHNYQIIIEYDGTKFVGWQYQKNGSSIQETLEKSIKKILKKQTLLVVDDSPIQGYLQQSKIKKGGLDLIPPGLVPGPTISGKGSLIHEYAVHTDAKLLFSSYQTGWIGFNKLD